MARAGSVSRAQAALLLSALLLAVQQASCRVEQQDEELPIRAEAEDEDFIGWKGEVFDAKDTFGDAEKRPWVETISWKPRASIFHNFLTHEEADHLVELARPHMRKSEIVDSETGRIYIGKERTSSGHFLERGQDEVVKQLEERIAEWTRLPVENGEAFHILHYKKGEEYQEHFDLFFDDVHIQTGGQRAATVILYLSDVDEGGETVFPSSEYKPEGEVAEKFSQCGRGGLAVKPRKGDALLFWSLKPDGKTHDNYSLHAGCPPCPNGEQPGVRCEKWSATKWIRVGKYGD